MDIIDDICRSPKNIEADWTEAFPGTNVADECVNIVTNLADSGDQLQMDMQIESYINTNGQPVLYYPYLYNIDRSEKLIGEDLVSGYAKPFDIIAYIEIADQPAWLVSQGADSDDTATIWLHIKTFKKKVNKILASKNDERVCEYSTIYNTNAREENDVVRAIQPKSGDLLQLTIFGCDREWDRGNKIFEITNVEDELFSQKFNLVGGHYVWRLTAKRFRYSFEEGISRLDENGKDNVLLGMYGEKGNHPVHEHQSIFKMFLSEEGMLGENDEEGAILTNEDGDNLQLAEGRGVVKIEYTKPYKYDVDDEGRHDFDMEQRVPGFYKDAQMNVISNGWLDDDR